MKTCYVSIPFNDRSLVSDGSEIDFSYIYHEIIKKAVADSGLDCFRADELRSNPVIHKATLSMILNCDLMIADVSSHNPNVLYELGLRHAVRPGPTIVLLNARENIPFDLTSIYALHYRMQNSRPSPEEAAFLRESLMKAVRESDSRFNSPLHDLFPELHVDLPRKPCVFIGHGRSLLWTKAREFLEKEWKLEVISYESESRAGESIVLVLEKFIRKATFAVLVLTAEDDVAEGQRRARQNVIHELGLFQGVLGFGRVVILRQEGVEELSNLAGLQYISFTGDAIQQTFFDLQRTLRREGLIS